MISLSFFGVFLGLMFLLGIFMFMQEKDIWYKTLYFGFIIMNFVFLTVYSFYMIGEDFGMAMDNDVVAPGRFDPNILTYSGVDVVNSDTYNVLMNFNNVDNKKQGFFDNALFCFDYNNTDEENVVRVVGSTDFYSDYVYLPAQKQGSECIDINITPGQNSLIGLNCDDCDVTNTLNILRTNTIINATVINATVADPAIYTLEYTNNVNVFYLKMRYGVADLIKRLYFFYLIGLSMFILGFGYRWGIKNQVEELANEAR